MNESAIAVEAEVGEKVRVHKIWIVPIVALLMGLWMVYASWMSQGPTITVSFVSGEGIEAGKTKVKRKNVEVGEVTGLALAEDGERVSLTVQIHKEYQDLLRDDVDFWIVRPRVGPAGISGLGTLLSGAYVEMTKGESEEFAQTFIGLETPPLTPPGTPGLHVTLSSDGNRRLVEGQPVTFRGSRVGRIEAVRFDASERRSYYTAFIDAPHDELITENTRFWFSSGVALDLSSDGLRIEMAAVETLLEGGVSFDVPKGQSAGLPVRERRLFALYANQNAINETQFDNELRYILLVDDSIRGLRPGAPVEYRGVRIGEVLRTDINYAAVTNLLSPGSRIPVLISITPARLGFADTLEAASLAEGRINELLTTGLHATVSTGSLVTGQKLIELEYIDTAYDDVQVFASHAVIPTAPGQMDRLLQSAMGTINGLNDLPLDDMVRNISSGLAQVQSTLKEFDGLLADDSLRQSIENLSATLKSFEVLAQDFSAGSDVYEDLQRSLVSLEISLNDLQPVLRQVRDRPNSLVFGERPVQDILPTGSKP
ncbi:MAG: intermembrane transport protein PqiB [Pseudomonadota bacterium]